MIVSSALLQDAFTVPLSRAGAEFQGHARIAKTESSEKRLGGAP